MKAQAMEEKHKRISLFVAITCSVLARALRTRQVPKPQPHIRTIRQVDDGITVIGGHLYFLYKRIVYTIQKDTLCKIGSKILLFQLFKSCVERAEAAHFQGLQLHLSRPQPNAPSEICQLQHHQSLVQAPLATATIPGIIHRNQVLTSLDLQIPKMGR